MRRTKIVCTLGPASLAPETIASLIRAGMNVARLNTSHGTIEEHVESVALVRRVADEVGQPVGVLMDLAGPKLRTGLTEGNRPVQLETGGRVRLTSASVLSTGDVISVEYPHLVADVSFGEHVLLDDGNIELLVMGVAGDGLDCRVLSGGPLGSRKGVSFPHSSLSMPALTDRDREAIKAGVAAGVDLFALSFVQDASDLIRARECITALGADTPIVAKIERRQAVEHLDEIMAEADGAMVARGDLGVELPPEEVPVQQRRIIAAAARNMIPVITATQMLESMVNSPRPTRAESSDVANATWDLSDALMLSGETAVGHYPVEAVAMMDRIISRAEEASPPNLDEKFAPTTDDHSYVVALAARQIIESDANMRGIVCFTRSGYTAFLLSKVHTTAPIFAVSPSESVCRRLTLARGVVPLAGPLVSTSEEMLGMVDRLVMASGHVREGEEVVVVASLPVSAKGSTNFLKLHRVGESERY